MADTKVSALAELSVADFSDDIYIVDDTGPTSNKLGTDRLFGLGGFLPGGRLTLTTAVPVTTADVTAAGTLFYTPYLHDRIRIYNGTRWRYYTFTERSLALTLTSGKNYDVFIFDNAGTLTLELSAAWTNDTTRADALTTQDAVQVKSGATTRLWLGLIRASGTNVTEDSLVNRFVVNAYNAVARPIYANPGYNNNDANTSYTETSTTWVAANGGTGSTIAFLTLGRHAPFVSMNAFATAPAADTARMGIALDSNTNVKAASQTAVLGGNGAFGCAWSGYVSLGKHSLILVSQVGGGTGTFFADFARVAVGGADADIPITFLSGVVFG